jgi:nitrogen fixation protein FixH
MSAERSAWRFFPWAVAGAFAVVFMVNGGMVWSAIATFPGVATTDDFGHSNRYDAVLAAAAREAALGWQVRTSIDDARAVLVLTGRDGQPLTGARIVAIARRPLGPDAATPLAFREVSPGRYMADRALGAAGQWELLLSITRGADMLHAAPRLMLR